MNGFNTFEKQDKVLIGMSGGVDSAVAAYLMQQEGYQCVGATMRLFCCSGLENIEQEISDARAVCAALGMEHIVLDYTEGYVEQMLRYSRDYSFLPTYND